MIYLLTKKHGQKLSLSFFVKVDVSLGINRDSDVLNKFYTIYQNYLVD